MTAPSLLDELASEAKWLRKAAEEIAKEGHAGWGNTCTQAAECIERHHAEIADMAKRLEALQSLAAAMYQAAGAYNMPVRFLDVLSAAGNGKPITEAQVDALLPCETPDTLQRLETAGRDAA